MQEKSQLIILLVIACSAVFFVLGVFFIILFRKYVRNLKQKQKDAMTNLFLGQHNERARIARDLHDGIVPDISSIISILEEINIEDNVTIKIKDLAKKKLTETIEAIRQVSHDLMSETLDKHGLIYALRELLGKESNKGICFYFTDNTYDLVIAPDITFHLYKITQELIHNSFKHSSASNVSIALFYDSNKNLLQYTFDDNGKGFTVNEQNDGIGLQNINSRVLLLNGSLRVNGNNGFGLSILINL